MISPCEQCQWYVLVEVEHEGKVEHVRMCDVPEDGTCVADEWIDAAIAAGEIDD